MKTAFRTHIAAAMLLLPMSAALVAEPAAAQQRAVVAAQPGIRSMALNSTAGLAPGATLRAQVYATPGAGNGHVTLGRDGVRIRLREQSPGNYVGTHTIARGERIDPTSIMTARVSFGERIVSQGFYFPPAFQALAMGAAPAAAPAPVVERFSVNPRGRLVAGRELRFRLVGTPGAHASVRIPGVVKDVDLRETRRGVYEGSYTIRRQDDLDAFDRAVATLREGNVRTTARLEFRDDDDRRARRDDTPPQVSDITPAQGERVDDRRRTRISARITDDRSGVDPDSVRLRLDGRNVSSDVRFTDDGRLRYRDELARGDHTAELVVRDRAGNVTRTEWSFRVI